MLTLFGWLTINPTAVAQFFINLLAVGGGYLVGTWLTQLVTFVLDRWLFRGKTSKVLHEVASRLGGVALALLVALIVFGSALGGFGIGGGPGSGVISGTGTDTTATGTPPPGPETPPPTEPPLNTDPAPPEQRLRVTLLGGDQVQNEKFYLIEDDRTPQDFLELVNRVKAQQESTKKSVALEIRFTSNNPLSLGHGAVTRLINWAKANQHTVSFPASKP